MRFVAEQNENWYVDVGTFAELQERLKMFGDPVYDYQVEMTLDLDKGYAGIIHPKKRGQRRDMGIYEDGFDYSAEIRKAVAEFCDEMKELEAAVDSATRQLELQRIGDKPMKDVFKEGFDTVEIRKPRREYFWV